MMNEGDDLEKEISEIENSNVQKVKNGLHVAPFELKPYYWLVSNLSGNNGAFFIRALLSKLNVDEHHVFKWRLENKFKQYQVFNYYISGCMPETLSFSKQLNQDNGIENIKELFSKGFFLKATLGDASFSTKNWDKTAEFEQLSKLPNPNKGKYDSYMVQRKLSIRCEFRVHTFSKDIIPRLTYLVQG